MLAGAMALASATALADTAVYSGSLGVPNVGYASYQEDVATSKVYAGIVAAQQQVMGTIKSTMSAPIMSVITGVSGYQPGTGYVSVSGPVTLTLSNGVATFSGLQVAVSMTVKQSQYGITASCVVTASTNPGMTVSGKIDPIAGTFTVTEVKNFTLSTGYLCSTNVDWVPIVNVIVDTLITQHVDQKIATVTQNAYNKLSDVGKLEPIHFMGLDSIPNGVLVYNGTDYAAQLRAGLANLFYSTTMSVTIGDPKRYITGTKGFPHTAYSTDLLLSFSINGFSFQLIEKRTYVDEIYCPPSGAYCYFY